MPNCILISGEICSGKDTLVNKYYSNERFIHVDLGSLVRKRFNTAERIFDNTLEDYFMFEIDKIWKERVTGQIIVITGLRQVTLCQKIAAYFDLDVHYIYLTVPRSILRKRFESRADAKDAKLTFDEALKGDQSLGLEGLQQYLLTEVKTEFIKTY